MPARTPEEIRASIESNRKELGSSLERLRVEAMQIADWRAQLRRHHQQAVIGAAGAGFVLGGGIGALGRLTFGRRRRRAEVRLEVS
jgi:orotate phosphoribosyltransferase-like protein